MPRIALNDAFHRLIGIGVSQELAWLTLNAGLKRGGLKLWCDGTALALDYVVNQLRIVVHRGNLEVMPAGPLGWAKPPNAFTFEIDIEEFERLLPERHRVGRRPKVTAKFIGEVKAEIAYRRKVKRLASWNALAKHFGVSRRTIARCLKK